MELIIDKNGKAVDFEDVSVTIICESKEDADRMKEGMASGRVRLMEWHPIKTRPLTDEELRYYYDTYGADSVPDSMLCGEMPEDDQMILITYRMKNGDLCVAVDTCTCDEWGYYLEDFEDFDQVIAWAPLPEPYGPREEET